MAYTNIDDPSAYFQTALYTGDGSTSRDITNDGNSNLQPDWVWIKQRSGTRDHALYDSSRGVQKRLTSNSTAVEATSTVQLSAFNADGFEIGSGNACNENSQTYAAWQWKANGGTTSSNTDGSKTATVQANTDAGFSIVTYAGSGTAATVGHGLADTPDVIIFKNRSAANVWATYHQGLGNNYKLELNSTNAQDSDGSFMNGTLPTSSVFTVGASVNTNGSGSNYVAYCFAEKQGYSKFGKYVGNANANGTFVYTGFKPAWVMVKRSDGTSDWTILDSKRPGYNLINKRLVANSAAAEATYNVLDFVSNGFKFRDGDGIWNGSGSTYIYMAFGESSFVTSGGIPTTAR